MLGSCNLSLCDKLSHIKEKGNRGFCPLALLCLKCWGRVNLGRFGGIGLHFSGETVDSWEKIAQPVVGFTALSRLHMWLLVSCGCFVGAGFPGCGDG